MTLTCRSGGFAQFFSTAYKLPAYRPCLLYTSMGMIVPLRSGGVGKGKALFLVALSGLPTLIGGIAGVLLGSISPVSVAYTHLDVYKRQGVYGLPSMFSTPIESVPTANRFAIGVPSSRSTFMLTSTSRPPTVP